MNQKDELVVWLLITAASLFGIFLALKSYSYVQYCRNTPMNQIDRERCGL